MTQPNDTQAPERIWAWEANTHLWCSDQPRTEYKHAATPYLRADLAAAQTAAAWLAGRDAASQTAYFACGCQDAIDALTPPADASAALDRLIAERVRDNEAVLAEFQAMYEAWCGGEDGDNVFAAMSDATQAALKARASKEGRDATDR